MSSVQRLSSLAAVCVCLLASACNAGHGEKEAQASTDQTTAGHGELQIEPGSRKLQYLKFGEATVGASASIAAATGKVAFDEDHTSRVGSPLSGRVESLLVKPGDEVKKGQPLLTIVSPEVEAAIADQRAAEADLALARRTLERVRGLYADRAVPQKDVSQAESDVAKSQAAVARSQARIGLLKIDAKQDSNRFTLRAPIGGIVVDRAALPGSEVRADSGAPLVTISELSLVWVLADVYERNLAYVKAGQTAELTVASYPGTVFKARIDHVGDVVDPQTRTVKIRLSAENKEHKLKPEMFARVTLPLEGPHAAVTVPSSAVLTDGENNVVMVVTGDNRFAKRNVEIGAQTDGRTTIISGLHPGERVVTEGALFLKAELENR